MARVIKEFWGCADGEPQPRLFKVGDTVAGNLAAVALREGWAGDKAAKTGNKK